MLQVIQIIAAKVSGHTRSHPPILLALPFKIVRIVNHVLLLACFPTKGYMALDTPHLITTGDFEDRGAAARTIFGVFVQKCCCGYVVRIAFVSRSQLWRGSCRASGLRNLGFNNPSATFTRFILTNVAFPFLI
jgi:hypothetical protein